MNGECWSEMRTGVLSASEAKKMINAFGVGRSLVRFFDALADGWFIIGDVRLEL